eukprot:m.175758 g.175758  ORF g.175758 m.175758 type:complete len:136 (+) comp39131_c2_seq44:294-701(+)
MTEERGDPSDVWKIARRNMRAILSAGSKKVYLEMAKRKLLTAAEDEELGAKYVDDYDGKMRRVVTKILPRKAEEQFWAFCECLEMAGFEEIAAFRKNASGSRHEPRLRSDIDATVCASLIVSQLRNACLNRGKRQ